MTLTSSQKHLMRFIYRDMDKTGWTKASPIVWPLLKNLPLELVELRLEADFGYAKLTHEGETVLIWS